MVLDGLSSGMKITVSHQPKTAHKAKLAAHSPLTSHSTNQDSGRGRIARAVNLQVCMRRFIAQRQGSCDS